MSNTKKRFCHCLFSSLLFISINKCSKICKHLFTSSMATASLRVGLKIFSLRIVTQIIKYSFNCNFSLNFWKRFRDKVITNSIHVSLLVKTKFDEDLRLTKFTLVHNQYFQVYKLTSNHFFSTSSHVKWFEWMFRYRFQYSRMCCY